MEPSLKEKLYGKAKSLAEKLADFADKAEDKVTGTAMLGAGIISRSNALTGKGIEKLTGKTIDESIHTREETDTNQQEINSQKSLARQSGYESDEMGNPILDKKLSFKERVQIANEFPDAVGGDLFNDEEREKMIDIKDGKVSIKAGFENRGDEILIGTKQTIKDEDLKKAPSFYPDEVKKEFISVAKENNYDIPKLSAQMENEMWWYDPDYVKKDEGAVGQGQHRDIFYRDINPEFKAKYGHDYDRTNPKDTFRATSLAMNKYMKRFNGSWEAALIAYNKGPDVVQEYIDDPNLTFDDDPYVKGVKAKLDKYQE